MALLYLRSKKKLVKSFFLLAIILLVITIFPSIYYAHKYSPKNVASIVGQVVSESEYNQRVREIDSLMKDYLSKYRKNTSVDELAMEELKLEKTLDAICKEAGIVVSDRALGEHFRGYSEQMEEVLKEIRPDLYEKLQKEPQERQRRYTEIRKQEIGFFKGYEPIIARRLKYKIILTSILSRLLTSKDGAPSTSVTIENDQSVDVLFCRIPSTQISVEDPTEAELKAHFQQKPESEKRNEPFRNIELVRFYCTPSWEESQEVKEELEKLKPDFEKLSEETEVLSFAKRNSVDNIVEKTWNHKQAPEAINRLRVGEVLGPTRESYDTWVLYKKLDKKAGKVRAYKIIKKARATDNKEKIKAQAKDFEWQVKRKSWKKAIAERGYKTQKIQATVEKANLALRSNRSEDLAIRKVLTENPCHGAIIKVENADIIAVGHVGKIGNKMFLNSRREEIKKEVKQTKKEDAVQSLLKNLQDTSPEAIKRCIREHFGPTKFEKALDIRLNTDKIGDVFCPAVIAKLLTLDRGESAFFPDPENQDIILALVTGKRKLRRPTIEPFTKKDEKRCQIEEAVRLCNNKNNPDLVQWDERYKHVS